MQHTTQQQKQQFVNQKEAAEIIGRSTRTIRNMEKEGKLQRCEAGVLYYIPDLIDAVRGKSTNQPVNAA